MCMSNPPIWVVFDMTNKKDRSNDLLILFREHDH
jgi:hypothetical protein